MMNRPSGSGDFAGDDYQYCGRAPALGAVMLIDSGQPQQSARGAAKVSIAYQDMNGQNTTRMLWPLGMVEWGDHWILLAWCEKCDAYRNFRFDRIQNIEVLPELYPLHPQRNLEHYLTKLAGIGDEQKPG